jgi:hypothetical protein
MKENAQPFWVVVDTANNSTMLLQSNCVFVLILRNSILKTTVSQKTQREKGRLM